MPGAGFVVLEVKGGQLTHDGHAWTQHSYDGEQHRVDPVCQARDAKYLLRSYVENDPAGGIAAGSAGPRGRRTVHRHPR